MKISKFTCLFLMLLMGFMANAQLPVTYYDFEDNSARNTTVEATPEAIITALGTPTLTINGGLTTAHGAGNATNYGGSINGYSLGYSGFTTNLTSASGDPSMEFGPFTCTNFYTFTLSFDFIGVGVNMPQNVDVYYSTNGTTFTRIITTTAVTSSWNSKTFTLPAAFNNATTGYIRIIGFNAGSSAGELRIDNLTLLASDIRTTTTLISATTHGTGLSSGGSYEPEYTNLTVNNAAATVTAASDLNFNGRITLTNGEFDIDNYTLTFQNSTLSPFARTSGTLTVGANANLVFGSSSVAASTLPNTLFTSSPANLASITIDRGAGNTVSLSNNPIILSGNLTVNSGTFAVNNASGDIEIDGNIAINNSGELLISAANNFTANNDVNVNNNGIFRISATNANASILGNLNINNTSTVNITGGSSGVNTNLSVSGNVLLDATLNLNATTSTITIAGNITGSGSVTGTLGTSNRIILTGTSNTISNSIAYGNIDVNSAGNISLIGNTTINGYLRLTAGNLVVGNYTLSLLLNANPIQRNGTTQVGNLSVSAGSTLTIGDGTQTANMTIPNETFITPTTLGNLNINKSSGTTNWGNNPISVSGNVNINAGTSYFAVNNASGTMAISGNLNINDGEFRVSVANDVTVAGNLNVLGTIGLTNANALVTVTGNVIGSGTQTNSSGRIVMVGSGTTLSNSITYDNVEINSAGNVSLTGSTTFVGFIRLTAGSLVVGNNTLTLTYNASPIQRDGITQLGLITVSSGSSFNYGDGTQTANIVLANNIFTTPTTLGYLNINKASGTFSWGNNPITISNDVNINQGTSYFAVNNTSGTMAIGGNLNINDGEFRVSVANDVTVAGNLNVMGTIGLTNANALVTVTGNVIGSGTQTNSSGRIVMVGSGTTLSNSITYDNVEINSAGNVSLTGSTTFVGFIRLTAGSLVVGANTLTLHTNNTPITRTSGTITLATTSSLAFGNAGNMGGNAFVIPNDVFSGTEINNFTIYRTNALTLNNQNFFLRGLLTISAGTLTLPANYLFTLRSTSLTNTAQVSEVGATGAISYGSNAAFRVERYIPQTGGTGYRAYRDLSTAGINTNGGTIYDNWQEGGGTGLEDGVYYGTHVSGKAGVSPGGVDATTGYDLTQTGLGSLSTFDVNGGGASVWTTWSTATSHTTKEALNAFKGYRVLIRGNRLVDLYQNPTPTGMNAPAILRTRGSLVTGDVAYTTTGVTSIFGTDNTVRLDSASATGFTIIPNPYACIVDWSLVYADATNISASYYLFDPNVTPSGGVYVTYNSTSDITVPAASAANRYIQPGQAIFVRNSSTSPTVTFSESHKAPTGDFTATFRNASSSQQNTTSRIYIDLNKSVNSNYILMDGAAIAFRSDFNNGDGTEDAGKISNGFENISIISKNNKQWSIEGRQQAMADDTVTLRMYYGSNGTVGGNYQLSINTQYFDANGLQVYLLDKYTNTLTPLSMTGASEYNYTVTSNASTYNLRFALVFKNSNVLPVSFITLAAAQEDKKVNVNWTVAENNITNYVVERGVNANEFSAIGNIKATGTSLSSIEKYTLIDNAPLKGNNYYRIKAIGNDGKVTYSSIVLVRINSLEPSITVYPNPIKDRKLNLLSENLEKDNYEIQLFGLNGQVLFSKTINHNGGTASYNFTLPNSITAGMYQLVIKGKQYNNSQSIIVE